WRLFRSFFPPLLSALLTAYLALGPRTFPLHDHLHWPLTLLVHPLAALIALRHLRTPSNTLIFLGALNIALAASFSWFAAFNLVVFSWLLALFNQGRHRTRAFAAVATGMFAACVIGKILWNGVYLGQLVAWQELALTVS